LNQGVNTIMFIVLSNLKLHFNSVLKLWICHPFFVFASRTFDWKHWSLGDDLRITS